MNTSINYIQSWWGQIYRNVVYSTSVMVEYTGIWYIQPWWGRIYRNIVYSTLVRSNIPEYGIFNRGKVEYTGKWYIQPW